ncbi:chemotaxis protein CheA [Consotaella salsifontis]|uniref:Chemotaxis protein CheA n=1 Tax=Consotaella salsifontis TaxID=1365950 RepID=A0A1T4QUU5_9HYPH|nr:chemotaxis protein CheA [Consotaella salsifontis]SKA07474.1 two-component system, chemotaxis family, sensor kinase CheA [Consotaella salsifontis]
MSGIDPIETFRQEAQELLETLEQTLLDLEQRPDDKDLVARAFRALHTLKGSGAMFGFTAVAEFLHDFETAFDRVRKGEAEASKPLVSAALKAQDHVADLVAGGDDPARGQEILANLRAAVSGAAPSGATPCQSAASTPAGAPASETRGWTVRFALPADALVLGTNPLLLLDELRGLAPAKVRAAMAAVPSLEAIEPSASYITWEVTLDGPVALEAIEDVFLFIRDDMDLAIEPLSPVVPETEEKAPAPETAASESAPTPAAKKPEKQTAANERAATSLRVSAERLDELMDRVGELVIAQARLNELAAQSREPALGAVAEEIARLTASLRDTTMSTRMVPIGSLFGRFRRLVHDLSRDLSKPIDFVTVGEETELDKTVIEQLADPLVHLIRNSVDHGVEPAERRCASGKSPTGTIRLSASYRGAEVAIAVTDDGAGLDAVRLRAKAEEQGLIAPSTPMADSDIYPMIFQPGFSTAKEVTSLSGRGVGMDVVKRTIDGLRGSIDIDTQLGRGTTVTLRLPLTLAIIDGLLVRVGDERYTIPLAAVEECVELSATGGVETRGRNFMNIRDALVPFLRLRELFSVPGEPEPFQKVVVVASGSTRVGLVVDQIIGNNQTVIKQLSRLHSGVKTFSGATILGDGTVALILDVMHLVGFGQSLEERRRQDRMGRAA